MGFKQKSFLNQRIASRVETCMNQGGNCIWLKEINNRFMTVMEEAV